MTKVLFICNQNQHRSVTAENLFKDRFETASAGLYNEKPVTEKELEWADVIVVMEEAQRKELGERFPTEVLKKRILNMDVPDRFYKDQPEFIELLKAKIDNQNI